MKSAAVPAQPRSRFSAVEWIIICVIAACLAVLAWLGYSAWRQGRINIDLSFLTRQSGITPAAGDPAADVRAAAIESEHPLAIIYTGKTKGLKDYRKFVDIVLGIEGQLPPVQSIPPSGTELAVDYATLEELDAFSSEALAGYEELETYVQTAGDTELEPYQALIRTEYIGLFDHLLELIGDQYIIDNDGEHAAYLLSDEIPETIGRYSPENTELLRQRWRGVVHERTQRLLDFEMAEEIAEVDRWLEAMTVLHRGFQREKGEIPEIDVRNGIPDKNARAVLDLLGTFLNDIESLAAGFDAYKVQIKDSGRSDRLKTMTIQFERLSRDDHLYAFTEIYRIYALDRRLKHPVYQELAGHFNFVMDFWPHDEMEYRRIFNQYEAEWATRFSP